MGSAAFTTAGGVNGSAVEANGSVAGGNGSAAEANGGAAHRAGANGAAHSGTHNGTHSDTHSGTPVATRTQPVDPAEGGTPDYQWGHQQPATRAP